MSEGIKFLSEILIAVAALLIAFFQWKDQKRIEKAEKAESVAREEEKHIVQAIVNQISEIEMCSDRIFKFQTTMTQLSKRTDNDPNTVMSTFDTMLAEYEEDLKKIYPKLKDLYIALLKNEDRFPMSHGYGRHIVDLREILDFDAVERERRNNNYDSLRVRIHRTLLQAWNNGGSLTPEVRMELGAMTEQMVRALEPYYKHAQLISVVLYELKVKYEKQ